VSGRDKNSKDGNWPKDAFGRDEVYAWLFQIGLPLVVLLMGWLIVHLLNRSWAKKSEQVIVYCAQDLVYAEPLFRDFEKRTGIKVKPVFDSEAVKTVGLANRLLAERYHPRCDVFWGNEELRTRQLARHDVFRITNGWARFGYRSRRIVINTNQLAASSAPTTLLELTNASWRGKIALAYPQFGTTATHFHALRQFWGDGLWEAWCRGLAANKPTLVDGNSVVVRVVGRGDAAIGLTDSDDIAAGQRETLPIAGLPLNRETLLIPNTVAVIRGCPHPAPAQLLYEFLQQDYVRESLVNANALEGLSDSAPASSTLNVDWESLLRDLDATTEKMNQIFLR
jgi:iron(III) transport system substrate-binding protein